MQVITPEISTVINTCIGIFISVFTAFLTHKIKQRDEDILKYRKQREEKEAREAEQRTREDEARDSLTLGMARTMLLDNYYKCRDKGTYTVTQRDVYHQLFAAYTAAGGDGVIDDLAQKIVKLPTD